MCPLAKNNIHRYSYKTIPHFYNLILQNVLFYKGEGDGDGEGECQVAKKIDG